MQKLAGVMLLAALEPGVKVASAIADQSPNAEAGQTVAAGGPPVVESLDGDAEIDRRLVDGQEFVCCGWGGRHAVNLACRWKVCPTARNVTRRLSVVYGQFPQTGRKRKKPEKTGRFRNGYS